MVETADGGEKQPLELFLGIGLDNRTAENALVNAKVTANLTAVIKEVATKYPAHAFIHRPTLLQEYIVTSKIKSSAQVDAALSFLANVGPEKFQWSAFEESCGAGVEVPIEEIEATVSVVLEENMDAILEQRY